jgi:hypothetical protein
MRARLSALAILALSAGTLTSGRADTPPLGQAVNFPEPMVVCKTHRELKELVEALRISVEAYDAKLKQLGVGRSECDVNTVSDVFVVESLDLGVVDFNHAQRRVWIVHFTNAAKDGWGLYEEAIASNAATKDIPTAFDGRPCDARCCPIAEGRVVHSARWNDGFRPNSGRSRDNSS